MREGRVAWVRGHTRTHSTPRNKVAIAQWCAKPVSLSTPESGVLRDLSPEVCSAHFIKVLVAHCKLLGVCSTPFLRCSLHTILSVSCTWLVAIGKQKLEV